MVKQVIQPVDLHCHSTASDGILNPAQLVSRAALAGVQVLALTDHDTCAGLEEARIQSLADNITLINGIELSCLWQGRTIHVVGLDFLPADLLGAVEEQGRRRHQRAETIAGRLEKRGLHGALEGAMAQAGSAVLGRPHFAHWLVSEGHVKDFRSAFKKYLGAGKVGDVKQNWPSLTQVVQWIVGAQGLAVLAHPGHYKMTRSKLKALLRDFCEAGGQAMEVCSGAQDKSVTANLAGLCREFELLASGGSDFHSPTNLWQELGAYPGLPADLTPVWTRF